MGGAGGEKHRSRFRSACAQPQKRRERVSIDRIRRGRKRRRRSARHLKPPSKHPLRIRSHRVQRPHRAQRLRRNMDIRRQRRVHRHAQRAMIVPAQVSLSRALLGPRPVMDMANLHRAHHHNQQKAHHRQHAQKCRSVPGQHPRPLRLQRRALEESLHQKLAVLPV